MQLNYHDNPKNGVELKAIDKGKDLGVINISSFSWNDHIRETNHQSELNILFDIAINFYINTPINNSS